MPAYSNYGDLIKSYNPVYYFDFEAPLTSVINKGSANLPSSLGNNLSQGSTNFFTTKPFDNYSITSGIVGNCLTTNNEIVEAPYAAGHDFNGLLSNSFTIATWIKNDGSANGAGSNLLSIQNEVVSGVGSIYFGIDASIGVYPNTNLAQIEVSHSWRTDNNSPVGTSYTKTIPYANRNNWYHVALVFTSTNTKFYVNGELVTTASGNYMPPSYFDIYTKSFMGRKGIATGTIGRIDEYAIFPSALTTQDILDLYNWPSTKWILPEPMNSSAKSPEHFVLGNGGYAAEVMTANISSGDHYSQNLYISDYMQTLPLEQYYPFNIYKRQRNSGTGGEGGLGFSGAADNYLDGGVGFSGAIETYSTTNTGNVFTSSTVVNSELTDGNFVIGFWYKSNRIAQGTLFSAMNPSGRGLTADIVQGGVNLKLISSAGSTFSYFSDGRIDDGKWHFVVIRFNNTGSQSQGFLHLWVDNVLQSGIANTTIPISTDLTGFSFPGNNTASVSTQFRISQFFIAPLDSITYPMLNNIYKAGVNEVQAKAEFPEPAVTFTSAYNAKVQSYSPIFDLRLNEATGSTTIKDIASSYLLNANGTSYSVGNAGKNFKGINFTNRNSFFNTWYSLPTGTFSTNDRQTLAVLVKTNLVTGNTNNFATTGGGGDQAGIGLFLGTLSGGTAATARINGGGAGTDILTGTTTITDGNWHLLVAVKNGTDFRLYVDGKLDASMTSTGKTLTDKGMIGVGVPPFSPGASVGALSRNTTIDEVQVFPTALTAQQVFELWQAITIDPGMSSTALMVDPTITTAYVPDVFTASANAVDPALSLGTSLNAFGVATASATDVTPTFDVTANIDYAAGTLTVSALMTDATIITQRYLDYNATPATASALLSANVYYGDTRQDTSYSLVLRSINNTTNTSGNSGFDIGANWSGGSVTNTHVLAIKPNSGFPIAAETVKAKFDPIHVTASSSNDVSPLNTFDVYVFTANPDTTFDTMTYGNMPAKEFIFTTRLVDDGSNTQFYLDLTPAFADSRSHTYGVLIEPNTSNTISGTQYDRTTFTGTNLQNHLIYVLTTDHVDKNINASPSTASGLFEMPTVATQRYVNIQDGIATVSAEMVDPDIATSDSVTINDNASLVSALLVNPVINISVNYTSDHLNAFAQGAGFIVSTTSNVNMAANAMTASGVFHMPQFDIGENNSADTMNASATFPMPLVVIPDTNTADIMTASATSPNATITTELKGRVFAEPMLASAFHVEQTSFYNFLADNWFARLNTFHDAQSGLFAKPFIKWMRQGANLGAGSTFTADRGYTSVGGTVQPSVFTASTSYTNLQTPLLEIGYFDDQNRKAVRFRNIAYEINTGVNPAPAGALSLNQGAYSIEMMFKTSKANQELFFQVGAAGSYSSGNTVSRIGIYGGKFYAMEAQVGSNYNDVVPWNTTYGKGSGYYIEGFKNIADGQWHHVVIQFGGNPSRTQIWIDGKLDVQRYGAGATRWPRLFGGNSWDSRGTADFYMSGISFLPNAFLQERDITLNYNAALGYKTVEATPMTATLDMTQNNNGRGNRPRALVLYWWPQQQGSVESRASDFYDDIQGIEFDYPTFFGTLDTYNPRSQKFYDWDAYTVDVTGEYYSEVVKTEAYSGGIRALQEIIGRGPGQRGVIKSERGFRDPVTDNRRYLDIFNDVDLDQVEAIFFYNYPDQSRELDAFARTETVDEYFNINEKQLYEQFLVGLRKAIDTGINVMISNPQLAIDLGIVDRVETVDPLIDGLSFTTTSGTGMPGSLTSSEDYNNDKERALALIPFAEEKQNTNSGRWLDYAFNNRLRIINTLNGVTNLIPFVETDSAFYQNNGLVNFGKSDELYKKVNYYPNGLSVGNEMLITDPAGQIGVKPRYQAVPFANVKAGKVIAAFGQTYKRKNETLPNPYANYATHIALDRGTILNGKPLGGRIWVTLTERPQFSTNSYCEVELTTDYWINLAYEFNLITEAEKTSALNSDRNLNRMLERNEITQAEYNKRSYWSVLGYNQSTTVSSGLAASVGQAAQTLGNAFKAIFNGQQQQTAEQAGLRSLFNYNPSNVIAMVRTYYTEPRIIFPSITLNGAAFGWLANKESAVGVIREPSATAQATMIDPTVVGDKIISVNAQAMVSSATAVDPTNFIWTQKNNNYVSLPMTATALMTPKLTLISAVPMTASAVFKENIGALITQVDEVILYLNHVDPVLYLREDVVK